MAPAHGTLHHMDRDVTPDVLPASQYLQERLQERRTRNVRPKRLRQSNFGPRNGRDDDIFNPEEASNSNARSKAFDSSPAVPGSRRGSEMSDSTRKRALGAKVMGEQMDRLTKENFALKLELDHRRQHTAKLQEKIDSMRAQVERADQLHQEHTELLRINSQLVEELEKRDKAVEEAMDIICDLEDKINDMEERNSCTRPSTANPDSGYAGTETYDQQSASSPPKPSKAAQITPAKRPQSITAASAATDRLLDAVNAKTPARTRREPSILSTKKQSTHALRSVYLETTQSLHPVKSFNSLLTRRESNLDEEDVLNSPRLSALSESSFPSIYSPKDAFSPDKHVWEAEDDEDPLVLIHQPAPHLRQDSIKRVSQWMDERDLTGDTPSKSNRLTSPLAQIDDAIQMSPGESSRNDQIRSKINALHSRADVATELSESQDSIQYIRPFPIRTKSKSPRPTSFGGPIFGEPLLPPTPESASTRMLRRSRSSIDEERSLLDTTPAVVKGFNPLEPGIRTAPKQMRGSADLASAYEKYRQRRDENALEDDDPNEDDNDASSETVRDLSMDYDGFPDGGSILMGTPSRFLKHGKPPTIKTPYDGYDLSPTEQRHPGFGRRQSSSDVRAGQRKPSMSRAETSPTLRHSYGKIVTTGLPSSNGSITSPRSYHSGSSSNRTILRSEDRARTMSPDLYRVESNSSTTIASPPRSRMSPSPGRTISQRAHGLLRRMSNTQKEGGSDREKSPLPTLTTAPSSTYVNHRQNRRSSIGQSGGEATSQPPRQPSRPGEAKRPAVQDRVNTAPAVPTLPAERKSLDTERKNLFKRSNSAKKWPRTPVPDGSSQLHESGGMRGAITRRRDSIKDAVSSATKRPWK